MSPLFFCIKPIHWAIRRGGALFFRENIETVRVNLGAWFCSDFRRGRQEIFFQPCCRQTSGGTDGSGFSVWSFGMMVLGGVGSSHCLPSISRVTTMAATVSPEAFTMVAGGSTSVPSRAMTGRALGRIRTGPQSSSLRCTLRPEFRS